MERCTIPLAFTLRQTVDLRDWRTDDHRHWRRLLAWITDLTAVQSGHGDAPRGVATAPPNAFRGILGHLASGEPIVDGAFVTASTPAGTAFRDGELLPVMRIVPSGAFLLGSTEADPDRSVNEGPQKRIEIPLPFAIGVFQVLVAEYRAAMGGHLPLAAAPPQSRQRGLFKREPVSPAALSATSDPAVPVTNVSFPEANAFVAAISASTGESYRLPSETEWEYACRAGSRRRFSCGDSIDATMAVFERGTGPFAPGAFSANAFGLHDMHGNVREWTADLWHEFYDSTPPDGSPALQGHSSMRVVRGGGWSDSAAMLRSTARMRATESIRSNLIGFRVVRALG